MPTVRGTADGPHPIVAELTRLREERGLSRRQVATSMGIQAVQLRVTEHGGAEPKLSTLVRYAEAIGVELSILTPPTCSCGTSEPDHQCEEK